MLIALVTPPTLQAPAKAVQARHQQTVVCTAQQQVEAPSRRAALAMAVAAGERSGERAGGRRQREGAYKLTCTCVPLCHLCCREHVQGVLLQCARGTGTAL